MAEATGPSRSPEERSALRESAERCIRQHTLMALGAAVVPLPLADLASISGVQLWMLKKLSELYRREGRFLNEAVGVAAAETLGRKLWGSLLKGFPGLGTLAGGAIQAAIAGTATYALGRAWLEFLEGGRSFSAPDFRGLFERWIPAARRRVPLLEGPEGRAANRRRALERLFALFGDRAAVLEEPLRTADARSLARLLARLDRAERSGRPVRLHEILRILDP
jgi:uncharacterized protein (DUF697 family)